MLVLIRDMHKEITHDPLLFSAAQGIYWTVLRETLTQYITFNRGEEKGLYSSTLGTLMSCIDPSVRIVTKSPKVGPLLISVPDP